MRGLKNILNNENLKNLVSDSSWTMFSQVFVMAINFATVFILANLFTPNDYGQFKLITTWLAIALGVGYTGYIYTLPQKISKGETYNLYQIFKVTFIKSLPTFLGIFLVSGYYIFNQNFNLGVGFFFAAVLAPILSTSTLVNTYYMGKKNFKMFALAQNFVDLVQFLALAFFAYISQNFIFIISAYFTATIFANILIIYNAHKDSLVDSNTKNIQNLNIDHQNDEHKEIRKKLNFSAIIFGFVGQIDKLLIFHFLGAVSLAVYSIVTAISDQARTPSKAISSVLFPRMNSEKFSKKNLYQAFFLLTAFCILMVIVLLSAYPIIFKYIFPKYVEYIYLANIATLSVIFAPMNLFYLYAQSKNQLDTLNIYAYLNIFLQIICFGLSAILGSLELFLYSRIFIYFVSTVFLYLKIKNL